MTSCRSSGSSCGDREVADPAVRTSFGVRCRASQRTAARKRAGCAARDRCRYRAVDGLKAAMRSWKPWVARRGGGASIGTERGLIAGVQSHTMEAMGQMSERLPAERKTRFATRAVPAVAVAVALLVSACGSTGNGGSGGGPSGTHAPASSTTTAGGGVMTLTFTVAMTGAAPGSGSFSVKYPPPPMLSCSHWFATYSALPEIAESVGGQYFYMVVGLKAGDYHGPGTYAIPSTAALEAVDLGSHEFGVTGAKLTLNADGSGSLNFKGVHGLLGEIESGTIRWTCS